jgi:hypothetical protein
VQLHQHQQGPLQRKSVALHPPPPLAASACNQIVTTNRRLPRSRATKARSSYSSRWAQYGTTSVLFGPFNSNTAFSANSLIWS